MQPDHRDTSPPANPRAPYGAHVAFAAVARNNPHLGALILGLFLIELLNGFLLGLMHRAIQFFSDDFAMTVFRGDTTAGLLLQLFSFVLLTLSVVIVVRNRHGRGFFTLIGPPMTAMRDFRVVLPMMVVLFVAIEVLPPWWRLPPTIEWRSPVLWGALLPLSLLALLIQTSAEEVFYRGYIQQQIAARFSRPIIWLVVPNILFALSHFDNGTTDQQSMQYVVWAFFFGLAASDLTGRTGNIGAAVAFHLANNAYAFLLFGTQGGPDSGLALILFPEVPNSGVFSGAGDGPLITLALVTEIAMTGVMWLTARLALRR